MSLSAVQIYDLHIFLTVNAKLIYKIKVIKHKRGKCFCVSLGNYRTKFAISTCKDTKSEKRNSEHHDQIYTGASFFVAYLSFATLITVD